MKTGTKTGIMGGTFNPIHNGHLKVALCAKEYLALDEVLFIPSGISYMKKDVLSATHRYKMTELATQDYPYFSVSDIEMTRQGNTYTYDTLKLLTQKYPEQHFYFIMGADSLYAMESWYKPELLCKLCTIVCAVRDDYTFSSLEQQALHLKEIFHADINLLPIERIDISSTQIRHAIQSGQSVREYVPEAVADYIERYHIYG